MPFSYRNHAQNGLQTNAMYHSSGMRPRAALTHNKVETELVK
jgi:hypothetical protein